MRWRRVVGGIGRTLIGAGVLLALFVVYQLWGTALAERRAQDDLQQEFAALLDQVAASTTTTSPSATTVPPTTTTGSSAPASTTATTAAAPTTSVPVTTTTVPFISEGDAIAHLEIPKIGVDKIVVAGVSVSDLRRGPGHYPSTPLPGQVGNAAIAGHRTTYGAPFYRIDELGPGDEIFVTTTAGRFRYLVTEQRVVAPTELSVLDPTPNATLTLTACHPRYSARQRIVVSAALEPEPDVAPVVPTGPAYSTETTDPGEAGVGTETTGPDQGTVAGTTDPDDDRAQNPDREAGTVAAPVAAPLTEGWFSDSSAWLPTIAWALACTAVALAAWWVGRRWRRWPSYLLATPVFLVLLYLCFGQLTRLLPPNL